MKTAARLLVGLGPDTLMTFVAIAGLAALAGILGGELSMVVDSAAPLLVLGALLLVTALARLPLLARDPARYWEQQRFAVRTWAPFVLLYMCYRALHRTMNLIVTDGVEDRLRALDEALLGLSPSWWFERFASPWLTEVMAFAYGLMFFLPLTVLVLLYARDRRDDFREVALAVLVAFYVGFVLYLLVPARSPRIVYAYERPLVGAIGLYELSTLAWDRLQQVTYDAFPSLHTAISSVALAFAWRHGDALSRRRPRLLFWIFLPNVIALQISTLYLRQHYFVDLIGGWALAAFTVWLASRAVRGWKALAQAV